MTSDSILTEYAIAKKGAIETNPLMKDKKVRIAVAFLQPLIPLSLYSAREISKKKSLKNLNFFIDSITFILDSFYGIVVGNNIYQLLAKSKYERKWKNLIKKLEENSKKRE